MKKFYAFMVAALAICSVACTPANNGGDGNDTANFKIDVSSITETSAYMTVTAASNKTFYFDVFEKAILDSYATKEDFAAEFTALLVETCEAYGVSFKDVLSSGSDSYFFENLDPGTAYYAFAYHVDGQGNLLSNVEFVEFKSLEGSGNIGGGENVVVDNLVFANYENYGDFYESGAANWYIQMQDYSFENMVVVEVQTALNATSFVGTYPVSDTFAAGTAVYGFTGSDDYLYGTLWGLVNEDDLVIDAVLAASGSVTIAEAAEGYTITVDIADENGRTAKVTYTGAVEPFPTEATASRYSTAVKLNKRHALKVEPKSNLKRGMALIKAAAQR